MKKSNFSGFIRLILPIFCAYCFFTFLNSGKTLYLVSQISGALFLTQCFILLHEFGHNSFFKSTFLNTLFGHITSLFIFIPFKNWTEIHRLHHVWAGWRDKDPTTENTMADQYSKQQAKIINFCWKYYIPLFTLGYRFGTYWSSDKLKRHLPQKLYSQCQRTKYLFVMIYTLLIAQYYHFFLLSLPALIMSFMITELITLSQHAHIRMKDSENKNVLPLKSFHQADYSRSLEFPRFISEYFLFNINYHEAHHQYPGIPCYYLPTVKVRSHNSYRFFPWLKKVKLMNGIDFIFRSSEVRKNF